MRKRLGWVVMVVAICLGLFFLGRREPVDVRIGAKVFTESLILAEIAREACEQQGLTASVRELGGSEILWRGLLTGEIDCYPEYSGTLIHQIFQGESLQTEQELQQAVAAAGVRISAPLGFSNNYALGMKRGTAERLGIKTTSDLRHHPELRISFSSEFMARADGWPALQRHYQLPQQDVRGMSHDLAYQALVAGQTEVIDIYTTDAEIADYDLLVLADDQEFFPDYQAVYLYRADLEQRAPQAVAAIESLGGAIDMATMIGLNQQVKIERQGERETGQAFVAQLWGVEITAAPQTRLQMLANDTKVHLWLVGYSLTLALVIALPLGIGAAYWPRTGAVVLSVVSVLQTIPSLALFVFMIPVFGLGNRPAICALVIYSLLPIVRNTTTGLTGIPPQIRDSAQALGLSFAARLFQVELPLALPVILAGVKTAAVWNVGTAVLGALIGAGGLGQPILTGLRLNDQVLILQAATLTALLALTMLGAFALLERYLVPHGLRMKGAE